MVGQALMQDARVEFCGGRLIAVLVAVFAASAAGQEADVKGHDGKGQMRAKLAEVVMLGEAIVQETTTHPLSKGYVGNSLKCTSCHLENGRHTSAGTFVGTATAYPAWSPRENRVITLEDRVLNCFMRSCNGFRGDADKDEPPASGRPRRAQAAWCECRSG
jgi:thiosulfate dehydrogenase